jgi:DNA polymerase-1
MREYCREIRDQHKIIDVILEYRELSKLRSTYTDALIDKINPKTGRAILGSTRPG